MIIALYCVAAAMVLGGTYSAMSGWDIVIIERGWTQVLSGVIVATGGVLLAGIAFLAGEVRQMTARLARQPATEAPPAPISRPSAVTDEPAETARRPGPRDPDPQATDTRAPDTRLPDPGAIPLAAGAITGAGALAAQTQRAQDEADADRSGKDAGPGDDSERIAMAGDTIEEAQTEEISEDAARDETEESRAPMRDPAEDGPAPDTPFLESDAGISPVAGAPEEATLSDADIFADLLAGQTAGAEESAPRDVAEHDDPEPEELEPEDPEPEDQASEDVQPESSIHALPQEPTPQAETLREEPAREEPMHEDPVREEPVREDLPPDDAADSDSSVTTPPAPPADEAREAPGPSHPGFAPDPSEPEAEPAPSPEAATGPDAGISAEEEAPEAAPEEPAVAPDDLAIPPPSVIGTYESGGNTYTMYADGSIDAHTPDGDYHFASLDDLKRFIAEGGESGGP